MKRKNDLIKVHNDIAEYQSNVDALGSNPRRVFIPIFFQPRLESTTDLILEKMIKP